MAFQKNPLCFFLHIAKVQHREYRLNPLDQCMFCETYIPGLWVIR